MGSGRGMGDGWRQSQGRKDVRLNEQQLTPPLRGELVAGTRRGQGEKMRVEKEKESKNMRDSDDELDRDQDDD